VSNLLLDGSIAGRSQSRFSTANNTTSVLAAFVESCFLNLSLYSLFKIIDTTDWLQSEFSLARMERRSFPPAKIVFQQKKFFHQPPDEIIGRLAFEKSDYQQAEKNSLLFRRDLIKGYYPVSIHYLSIPPMAVRDFTAGHLAILPSTGAEPSTNLL
jgi:hypothetical protein